VDRAGSATFAGSGSRSRHADPDRYKLQANEKVEKEDFFPENFNMLSKILKTYVTFDTDENIKNCKVAML